MAVAELDSRSCLAVGGETTNAVEDSRRAKDDITGLFRLSDSAVDKNSIIVLTT